MNIAKYNKGYNFILVGSFGFLVNYFTNNLLARHLSIAEYGDLSLGLQYLVIISSLVYMGLATTTKVYLPLYLKKNQKNRVIHYKSWSSLWVFRNAAIFCLILFALYLVFYLMILLGWMEFQDIHLVFFLLLAVPFYAIFQVIASYFSADNAVIVADILQRLVSPLIILLVLLLFLVESAQLSKLQLVVIYTFSYGLVFCVSWFLYTYFFSRKDLFRQAAVDFEG
jgi:O-antigen/teichoic acid export membrane protein